MERDLTVIVVTCAARGGDLLAALLRQLDDDGWIDQTLIVSDGPSTIATRAALSTTPMRSGQMPTYWRALKLGVERAAARGQRRLLILEDDVELCRNALPFIASIDQPDHFDFVSWFDGHAVPSGAPTGLYARPVRAFACLQAVTWPLATAARLLESPRVARWGEPHRGDLLVSQILARGTYAVHVPNLVQHRGVESLCSPGATLSGTRVARNYGGPRLDAMTLAGRVDAGPRRHTEA